MSFLYILSTWREKLEKNPEPDCMFETVIKNVQKLEHKTHWESNFSVIIESEIATKNLRQYLKCRYLF